MIERIFYGEYSAFKRGEMFEQKMTSFYISFISFLFIIGLVLAFAYKWVEVR